MVKNEGASTKYYSPDGFDKKIEGPKKDEDDWKRARALTDFEIDAVLGEKRRMLTESEPFKPVFNAALHCGMFPTSPAQQIMAF